LRSEVVVCQVLLDDAVEHRDQRRPLRVNAFVIFEKPTPRMSANASKSCVSGSHGTASAGPASEASGAIERRARSIAWRRSRIAAISAAEMRAPPRLAAAGQTRRATWARGGGFVDAPGLDESEDDPRGIVDVDAVPETHRRHPADGK
jgi:hypothetical protein